MAKVSLIALVLAGILLSGLVMPVDASLAPALATADSEAHDGSAGTIGEEECGHHDRSPDCPSCPACFAAPVSSPDGPGTSPGGYGPERRAGVVQFVPRRELPPPRFA